LIQLTNCDAKAGFRRRLATNVPDAPHLVVHPSYFTSAFKKRLADQRNRSSVIPTSSRIDIDHFKYGGILSKVQRVGLGEEVDAGEEEE
jgi:hypothetical protein